MNIGESLPRNAQRFPNKPAIVDAQRAVTYGELHERTNRLANYFLELGIGKGDRVGLSCGSRAEHFEALFALAKIGAVTVPYDYHWSAQECAAMVNFFAPKAFVLEGRKETRELGAILRERLAPANMLVIAGTEKIDGGSFEAAIASGSANDPEIEVASRDTFILMITSGTTGFPKACTVSHEAYSLRSLNYAITRGTNADDRSLMPLPVHFNAGRGAVLALLYLGGTVFIQERFNEETYLETIEREQITFSILVPTLCERLLRYDKLAQHDLSSLKYVSITSGHLPLASARLFGEKICRRFYEAYASTDCGQITTLSPQDREISGESVGKPIWCVRLKIADDDGREVAQGEAGEICLRTPVAIDGYYQNPRATAEFLQDGWCHTGDIGFVDAQGYLTISGRKKNMVKSGGVSIFPEEIEDALRQHPSVFDVAVVGFKSAQWGEAVKAFVVLNPGASGDAEALVQFCKESLAAYKAPKVVEFVANLPRTAMGKIDRGKLAAIDQAK